jgi:hypothetical protein
MGEGGASRMIASSATGGCATGYYPPPPLWGARFADEREARAEGRLRPVGTGGGVAPKRRCRLVLLRC